MAAPEATLVRGLPRSNGGVPQVEADHAAPLTRRGELFTPCFVCVGGLTTMFLYLLSFALIPTVIFAPFGIESFKTLDQYVFPGDIHFRAWKRSDGVWTILVTFNCLFLSPLLVVLCGVCILLLLVQAVILFPLAICISLCIPLADEYEFWPEFWYSFPQALRFAWTSVMLVLFPFISPWSVVGSIPKARPEKQTARKWQPNYGAMYGSYYQRATWDAYADAGDAGADEERMVGVKVGPTSGSVPLVAPDGTISAPIATVGPADVAMAAASASASASESAASGVGHVVMLPSGQLVPYADYAAALTVQNATTPLGQQGTRSIIQDYLTSTSVGSSVAGGSDVASEGVTTDEETEPATPVRRARPAVGASSPLGLPVAQDKAAGDNGDGDEEEDEEEDEKDNEDNEDEDEDEDEDDEDDEDEDSDETEDEEDAEETTENEDDEENSGAADASGATEDGSEESDGAALSPTSTINSNGPW